MELFCRRGQNSGKVRAVGYEPGNTFWKKFSPDPFQKLSTKGDWPSDRIPERKGKAIDPSRNVRRTEIRVIRRPCGAPAPQLNQRGTVSNISKAPHFPHPYPPNKSLIGTSKSPEALRRGGGVPGVMTQNTLLPPTAASVTMRGIPKGDPSPLGGALLELFCRRGQKSGKGSLLLCHLPQHRYR